LSALRGGLGPRVVDNHWPAGDEWKRRAAPELLAFPIAGALLAAIDHGLAAPWPFSLTSGSRMNPELYFQSATSRTQVGDDQDGGSVRTAARTGRNEGRHEGGMF
jgi:hypothetical protein